MVVQFAFAAALLASSALGHSIGHIRRHDGYALPVDSYTAPSNKSCASIAIPDEMKNAMAMLGNEQPSANQERATVSIETYFHVVSSSNLSRDGAISVSRSRLYAIAATQ